MGCGSSKESIHDPAPPLSSHVTQQNEIEKIDMENNIELPKAQETFISEFQSRYTSIKILGHGGFGCVFEGERTLWHLGKQVKAWKRAIKRIPLEGSEQEINYALNEVDTLLSFEHEGIVKFHDSWTETPPLGWQNRSDEQLLHDLNFKQYFKFSNAGTFLYISMELCESTLDDWLTKNMHRDLSRIKHWFEQIVSAVAYIHRKGKMHRDLKPNNILFARNDRVKVCDLGIVTDRAISEEGSGQEVGIPRTYNMGTEMYMAPEQKSGFQYSSKVDVFALGLILTELCVVMTKTKAEKIFNNYRNGRQETVLQHLPEVKTIVDLLTNQSDEQRPNCETILKHTFITDQFPPKEHRMDSNSKFKKLENFERFESPFLKNFKVRSWSAGGGGGITTFCKAQSCLDNCMYAVKRFAVCERDVNEALKEVSSIASLSHVGIVSYYHSWIEQPPEGSEDYPFFINDAVYIYVQTELCTSSLADWLRENHKRDLQQMKEWFKQIVSAVSYLHAKMIIHRDLKPSNILFDKNGRLKIGDLGCITNRVVYDGKEIDEERTMIGTPMYMAPEQNNWSCYSSKVDVFSLGLIFIELCSAMSFEKCHEVFNDVRRGAPISMLNNQPEVANFVAWLTKLDSHERPTCEEILKHEFLANV